MRETETVYYINASHPDAVPQLARRLQALMPDPPLAPLPVVLCIGTDRVTGDSLGPLVGTFLQACGSSRCLHVYGTLDTPVHALNLRQICRHIKKEHPRSLILAVDASLGIKRHLGYVTLEKGSLHPGAGVQKTLDAIGDISITGIIGPVHPQAQLVLQNTRLAPVTRLACCISQGILLAMESGPSRASGQERQFSRVCSPDCSAL